MKDLELSSMQADLRSLPAMIRGCFKRGRARQATVVQARPEVCDADRPESGHGSSRPDGRWARVSCCRASCSGGSILDRRAWRSPPDPDHRQGRLRVVEGDPESLAGPRFEKRPAGSAPFSRLEYHHLTEGLQLSPQRLTLKQGSEWGALGFAANTEEGFSGQHCGDLLVIVDEASGHHRSDLVGDPWTGRDPAWWSWATRSDTTATFASCMTWAALELGRSRRCRSRASNVPTAEKDHSPRGHGLEIIPESDARDPLRGFDLVALQHPPASSPDRSRCGFLPKAWARLVHPTRDPRR